jgi:Htaa
MPRAEIETSSPRARRRRTPTGIVAAMLCLSIFAFGVASSPAFASVAQAGAKKKKKKKAFTIKLTGGTATLTFTTQAWSDLNSSAGSTVGTMTTPLAPATSSSPGVLTFPVSGGSLNSSTGHGTVDAQGGFTIESHLSVAGLFSSSSSATAENPVLSLGTTSELTMSSQNFTPPSVPLFTLSLGKLRPTASHHAITIAKVPALLTTAGTELFGSSFHAGEAIATVSIQATG